MTLRIEHYGKSRYWALYDGPELVVVTLYKRGAQEVLRRLAAQPPAATEAAAQAVAVEAAAQQAKELAAHARTLARQARAMARAAQAHAQPAGPRPRAPLGQAGRRRDQRERHRCPLAPLVARSWRAITPGQREAPTPTTSPCDTRETRTARLAWTAQAAIAYLLPIHAHPRGAACARGC